MTREGDNSRSFIISCDTCGWKSRVYSSADEGGFEFAQITAVIETRLGHLKETARFVNGKMLLHKTTVISLVDNLD